MATLKEEAQAYEPSKTKNIADLDKVSVELEVVEETFKDGAGESFTIKTTTIDNEKYRVPVSVLKNLKAILEAKPTLKTFKVVKTGEGMNTQYTVVPLE